MNDIRYDDQFNLNEWFILTAIVIGIVTVFWLPRRFPRKTTGVFLLCGAFFGFVFDHTLSVLPVSYYVINDAYGFEAMDFFSHVMYAPFSYLFFYLYDRIRVKPRLSLLYILPWAFISVGMERLCVFVGVFHYRHGYTLYYSFAIYLAVLSGWVLLFHALKAYGDKRF